MKKIALKLITVVLVFLLASTSLSGITFGESQNVVIKDIPEISYVFGDTTKWPFENKKIESESFLMIDGEIAYCLDFSTRIDSNETEREKVKDYASLEKEQKELLQLAMHFGFTDVGGVTDYTDYFVTQVAIWLITADVFNTNSESDIINIFFEEVDGGLDKYNKLKGNILSAMLYPSFNGQTVALSRNSTEDDYEITITDTNNVLQNYVVSTEFDEYAEIIGNKLKITMKSPRKLEITMTREFNPGSLIYWIKPGTQALVTVDSESDFITASVTTTVLEQIEIEKTGETLFGVDITDTEFGEVYTPIYKEKPLEGVKFKLITLEEYSYMRGDGTIETKPANSELCEMTTDVNGKALSDPFPMFIRFKLIEVSSVNGYIGGYEKEDFHYDVKKDKLRIIVNNTRQKINFSFQKDMDLGIGETIKPYDEVVFGVFAAEKMTAGNDTIPAKSLVALVTPDSNGKAECKDLPAGRYYLKELKTAQGYILNETEHAFTLTYENDEDLEIEIALNDGDAIINNIIKGKGKVKKTDSSGKGLAGAVFHVYTEDGFFVAEVESDKTGNTPEIELSYGRYYWVEIKAPDGCKLDKTKYYFEIIENGFVYETTVKNHYSNPKTGDENNVMLWVSLAFCSALVIWSTNKRRKLAIKR